jgi:parvulin-like peptidyl-prolyl isomerase
VSPKLFPHAKPLLACVLAIAYSASAEVYTDGLLARVNDEIITVFDVGKTTQEEEKRLASTKYRGASMSDPKVRAAWQKDVTDIRVRAAERMIDHHVVYGEFKSKGYTVLSELIERRIDSYVRNNAGGDYGKFEQMLSEQGLSLNTFRENLEKQLAVDLLVNQEVDSKVSVAPGRIESWYKDNEGQFVQPGELRLNIIVLKPKTLTEAEQADRLKEVQAKIVAGQEFTELAKAYSDHYTRNKGGALDWMRIDQMNPALRGGFETLALNTLSKPIKMENDTWLMKIAEVKESQALALDAEMRGRIGDRLLAEARAKRYREFVDSLRDQAFIRRFYKTD